VRLERARPEGIYPAFNRCFELARGEFVHIATSDDTMAPDCLGKLVAALEANPDCELAHCPLKAIDEHGDEGPDWWSTSSIFARSSGEWLDRPHKRVAPHDGIVCLLGTNVYSSVTQLLIRRRLFERIGPYRSDWGSIGDFHWNLRAALAASAVHVPDTWGGWRMHSGQATAAVSFGSGEHDDKIDAMIDDAVECPALDPELRRRLRDPLVPRARELRRLLRVFDGRADAAARRRYVLGRLLHGSPAAIGYLASRLPGRDPWPRHAPASVRRWRDAGALVDCAEPSATA